MTIAGQDSSERRFVEAEKFLESLINSRPRPHYVAAAREREGTGKPLPVFGLERLQALLTRLGEPQESQRFVHLTGTSGKTSTSTMTAGLLEGHGFRTGLHTSPHLHSLCERLTINGEACSREVIVTLVDRLRPVLDQMYRDLDIGGVSYFEAMLALALKHFEEQGVDWTVLEAGLGGRYDGTNVISSSVVSVITNIGLDHTHILGDTRELIAMDKIGILKHGGRFVTAEQSEEILDIFREQCREKDNEIEVLNRDYFVESGFDRGQLKIDYRSKSSQIKDIALAAKGRFQAWNAALAIRATEIALESIGQSIDSDVVRSVLGELQVPGRLELVNDTPPVILDGAHNGDKMRSFCESVVRYYPGRKFNIVFAATPGRNLDEVLAHLIPITNKLFLTRTLATYRGTEDPKVLRDIALGLDPAVDVEVYFDPDCALNAANESVDVGTGILVTGSLYLVSDLRLGLLQRFKTD